MVNAHYHVYRVEYLLGPTKVERKTKHRVEEKSTCNIHSLPIYHPLLSLRCFFIQQILSHFISMASRFISDPPLSRDSTKKKRTNGSAKLKQIKLDVRREQWLSRVKKECCADSNGRVDYCPSSKHIASEENESSNKEIRRKRGEDMEGSCIHGNYLGSIKNGSTQSTFDHDESGSSFSGRSSSSGSMRTTSFSGNASEEEEEEEEEDDGCLDDWEAVADALNADVVVSESPAKHESQFSNNVPEAAKNPGVDFSKTKFSAVPESHSNCQAWKPNDALRPRCLPGLSKQHSSPLNSVWHGNHKTVPWAWKTIISQPSQCPICYEDLDVTDSSFLPCPCGFRLCLFCHKKILEADGRCPGCRKLYDHVDGNGGFSARAKAFHITQPCSMRTRC